MFAQTLLALVQHVCQAMVALTLCRPLEAPWPHWPESDHNNGQCMGQCPLASPSPLTAQCHMVFSRILHLCRSLLSETHQNWQPALIWFRERQKFAKCDNSYIVIILLCGSACETRVQWKEGYCRSLCDCVCISGCNCICLLFVFVYVRVDCVVGEGCCRRLCNPPPPQASLQ